MRTCSFLILLLVGIPSTASTKPPGTSVAQPAQLLPGLGNHHHAIATKSPEAQNSSIKAWHSSRLSIAPKPNAHSAAPLSLILPPLCPGGESRSR